MLPAPSRFAARRAGLIALIKPQFEAGPGGIGKGGRRPGSRTPRPRLPPRVATWLEGESRGWSVEGITAARSPDPEGNIEFLLYARRGLASCQYE